MGQSITLSLFHKQDLSLSKLTFSSKFKIITLFLQDLTFVCLL
ncbi:hypothetical protein SCG7109_BP_00020 [Chlamydiales bacterium SCGC AG-110-M15]|nr:hypothetical protein SCG7109_BP_00020 [Chlamydiales bacterium SCGC AG-110-M15]